MCKRSGNVICSTGIIGVLHITAWVAQYNCTDRRYRRSMLCKRTRALERFQQHMVVLVRLCVEQPVPVSPLWPNALDSCLCTERVISFLAVCASYQLGGNAAFIGRHHSVLPDHLRLCQCVPCSRQSAADILSLCIHFAICSPRVRDTTGCSTKCSSFNFCVSVCSEAPSVD